MKSDNFCVGAYNAFALILKNATQFTFLEGLAFILGFLSQALIVSGTCCICYLILVVWDDINEDLSSYFPPIFITGIVAYLVSLLFFAVFTISANTILNCFLMDQELGKVNGKLKASHVPKTLRNFLDTYKDELTPAAGGGSRERVRRHNDQPPPRRNINYAANNSNPPQTPTPAYAGGAY
jgi:hypothetical protein